MFEINGRTIRISQGDTGRIVFKSDADIGMNGFVLFTVRKKNGALLYEKKWTKLEGLANGEEHPTVTFGRAETRTWAPGEYEWDVRFFFNDNMSSSPGGKSEEALLTPILPSRFEVLRTVGRV